LFFLLPFIDAIVPSIIYDTLEKDGKPFSNLKFDHCSNLGTTLTQAGDANAQFFIGRIL
jgi:hypothetical protein